MPKQSIELNQIYNALSDATRRGVLARLSQGEAAVSELAGPFDMALPSFVQHLKVLEQCGLVQSTKQGRVRTFKLVPAKMKMAEHWLQQQQMIWEQRLDRLDAHLMKMKDKRKLK
jgi:DNA-binding transcriptional ArsR family regulator